MKNNTALLFPGGGAHYVGMGKSFYANYSVFRDTFVEASELLGINFKALCFEQDIKQLSAMNSSQIAIFTVSVGMYRVFFEVHGLVPMALAGHSLGEYAALSCAGAVSFKDGLRMVQKRGELLQEVGERKQGKMMAVNGLPFAEVETGVLGLQAAGNLVYLSNYNSSHQVVLSGSGRGIENAAECFRTAGAECIILPIPACSHCPMMISVVEEFKAFLAPISFQPLDIPVYSNLTGFPYRTAEEIKAALPRHLVEPVYWERSMKEMRKDGVEYLIEMGPQEVLKHLNRFIEEDMVAMAYDNPADRQLIDSYLSAISVESVLTQLNRCLVAVVTEPNQNQWSGEKDCIEMKERFDLLLHYKQQYLEQKIEGRQVVSKSLGVLSAILQLKNISPIKVEGIMSQIIRQTDF